MAAYARAVSDPSDAAYGHHLTASEARARFGATAQQATAVERWLAGAGLHTVGVTAHTVTVTGTAAAAEKAFGTAVREYATADGVFRAPAAPATVPAALGPDVLAVTGLDDRPSGYRTADLIALPQATGQPAEARPASAAGGPLNLNPTPCSDYFGQKIATGVVTPYGTDLPYLTCGYTPQQLRGAYGAGGAGASGAGYTVAVVGAYGSSTMPADANTYSAYRATAGFAPGQYTEKVTQDQWTDLDVCSRWQWTTEQSLDVEAVHAVAPDAKVLYYGANSCKDADLVAALADIVDNHRADIVSASWGDPLATTSGNQQPSIIAEYEFVFELGAVEGIGFDFSSGDCGDDDPATACGAHKGSSRTQAEYPAASPWVTAVGGTTLAIDGSGHRRWESGWGSGLQVRTGPTWTDTGFWQGAAGVPLRCSPSPGTSSASYPVRCPREPVVRGRASSRMWRWTPTRSPAC
ncbi:protease pro-enzyme activation domain-containing protein [Catenulispora yoronensis]